MIAPAIVMETIYLPYGEESGFAWEFYIQFPHV